MKARSFIRIAFLSMLVSVGFVLTTHARTFSGDSFSSYGNYTLEKAKGQLRVNDKTYKTYVIQYENSEDPVLIVVDKGDDCCKYIVKAKDFEVQYQCVDGRFGVQLINEKYASLDDKDVVDQIDGYEFSRQGIITHRLKSEREMVELIAAYYPEIKK